MERESVSTANADDEEDESMIGLNEYNNPNKRKQTSSVWKSFKKVKKPNGEVVAICDHCSSSFVGNSGTSNLRNHLKRKHKEFIDNSEASSNPNTYIFDQERSRKDLATMVVKHNYPLSMVDHKYFKRFSQGLNPEFIIHTRNTIRADIINIYKEEKEKVYAFLDSLSCKFDICTWEKSTIEYLSNFAAVMKVKYDKYWDECSLVLALGIFFDPQFKLKIVKFHYKKLYGALADPYIERVSNALDDLYQEYSNITHGGVHEHDVTHSTVHMNDKYSAFDEWLQEENPSGKLQKSEVDTYLDDPLFPRVDNFCVLQWWKLNASNYPVLSRIARDVLAVPTTTIASESAFSVGGRTIDETRSSMLPELVEALVTTNDWIE